VQDPKNLMKVLGLMDKIKKIKAKAGDKGEKRVVLTMTIQQY